MNEMIHEQKQKLVTSEERGEGSNWVYDTSH